MDTFHKAFLLCFKGKTGVKLSFKKLIAMLIHLLFIFIYVLKFNIFQRVGQTLKYMKCKNPLISDIKLWLYESCKILNVVALPLKICLKMFKEWKTVESGSTQFVQM